jgi:hypothetical protein
MAKLPIIVRRFACCPFLSHFTLSPITFLHGNGTSFSHLFCRLCSAIRKPNETMRLIVVTVFGVVFGFFIGISFPAITITKVWSMAYPSTACTKFPVILLITVPNMLQLHFPFTMLPYVDEKDSGRSTQAMLNHALSAAKRNGSHPSSNTIMKVVRCVLCRFPHYQTLFPHFPINVYHLSMPSLGLEIHQESLFTASIFPVA